MLQDDEQYLEKDAIASDTTSEKDKQPNDGLKVTLIEWLVDMRIDIQKRSAKMLTEMGEIRTDIVEPFTKSSFDFGAETCYGFIW